MNTLTITNRLVNENINKLKAHSVYTYYHSVRVGMLLRDFAAFLGFERNDLYILGVLHDIGKIRIPKAILNKPSRLTKAEFEEMKNHTIYGQEILLETKGIPEEFAEIVRYHHENWDSTGYWGEKGNDIPFFSRMIRIIDSYDSMMFGRIYQKPVTKETVLAALASLRGSHYDSDLVDSFHMYIHSSHLEYLKNY